MNQCFYYCSEVSATGCIGTLSPCTCFNLLIDNEDENSCLLQVRDCDYCQITPTQMDIKLKSIIWQCFPTFCASLIGLLFGLMLGWPSSAYPYLLQENSPIPVSLDQTAMIAGFLMIGASIASPFSTKYGCGTKYGILFCLTLNLLGWGIVLFGTTIYNLLAGRLIIGIGFGYGQGQAKKYIKDLCEPDVAQIKLKLLNLYLGLGIVVTFFAGCFCDYDQLTLVSTILSSVVLFICLFLPHTPLEYLQFNKERYAVKVLTNVNARRDIFYELESLKASKHLKNNEDSLCAILKNKSYRNRFLTISILTFLQQFTGLPATIVYCKIIFTEFNLNQPEMYAAIYALLFLTVNGIVTFFLEHLNKKLTLLVSTLFVSITMISIIFVIYYKIHVEYPFVPVIILYMYQFFHSMGLGTVPPSLIHEYFPPKHRNVIANYHLIVFCISALLITKVFQVLYEHYTFEVPFCMFFAVSVLTMIFIAIFVPYKRSVINI